jgi:hypothetical protein
VPKVRVDELPLHSFSFDRSGVAFPCALSLSPHERMYGTAIAAP